MNINIHTSHPSAFISSTFIDLREERNVVAEVLKSSGLNINALDVKPASNDSSKSEILAGIRESDFIIVIIGKRYGSIIPEMTGSRSLSITRWEYNRAVIRFRKHALVFFKNVNSTEQINYDDRDHNFELKKRYLAEFKNKLSTNHNPKYFTTVDELASEVKKALIPTYRTGVRNLLSKIETLRKELDIQKSESQKLNSLLRQKDQNSSSNSAHGSFGIGPRPNAMAAGLSRTPKTIAPSTDLGLSYGRNAMAEADGGGFLERAIPRNELGLNQRGILSEASKEYHGLVRYGLGSKDDSEK